MISSEEEESQEVIVTSAEHRNPTTMSAGNEQEAERRAMVPVPRKHAASADTAGEQEAKRTWSPRRSVASPVSSPPTVEAAKQARRSEERACTRASPGLALARDFQREDAPPAAPIVVSRAKDHGDPQAGQEPVGTTPPSAEVRGRGSQPRSGPRPVGPSTLGLGFRVVPLTSWYVFLCFFRSRR